MLDGYENYAPEENPIREKRPPFRFNSGAVYIGEWVN